MLSESWSKTPCPPMVPKRGLVEIDMKNDDFDGPLGKNQTPTPNIVGATSD